MTKQKNYEKWLTALLLVLMGTAFYIMCASNPMRWDDLMYEYVWLDHRPAGLLHPIDLTNHVDNVGEVFESQCNHFLVMNGRFIVHFITQCFCGFIGKGPFNISNALVYMCFLLLSIRFVAVRSLTGVVMTVAGLWLLLPVQWIFSVDVVFPINYLWSATMCLAFLLLFQKYDIPHSSPITQFLLLLFGIVCGNFHEGYTLLVSGALFFYSLFHFKQLSKAQWFLIVGLWIGTLTVIASPGIWGRAGAASAESISEMLVRKMDILRYSKRLYLMLAILVAGCLPIWAGRKKVGSFMRENAVVLTIIPLGLAFLFMLPYYSQRMGFPMELFAVLISLKFIAMHPLVVDRRTLTAVAVTIVLVLAVHVTMTVGYARKVGSEYCAMFEEYQQSPEGKTHFWNLSIPKPFQPYVYRLGVPFEQDQISFTQQKNMIIEN